jgi:phasin
MTKTAKISDTVEFPTFDADKATDQFRAFAEKGMEQSREAYAKMKNGAETTQKAVESTLENARAVSADLSLKSLAAMRAGADAGFSHLEALISAKSLSEVVELQTAFVRKSVEMAVENVKEMQTVSTRGAETVAQPMKDVFEKAVKELKVA